MKDGKVVKGINFVGLKEVGDPVDLAKKYYMQGADELVFLDITATSDGRETMVHVVEDVAKNIFMPFTVGGGIRSVEDVPDVSCGQEQINVLEQCCCTKSAADCRLCRAIWESMCGTWLLMGKCVQTRAAGMLSSMAAALIRELML